MQDNTEHLSETKHPGKAASCAVVGVGNILLQDEGFGVHLLSQLRERYHFEPEIQLLDGGTIGMELLGFMEPFDRLLLLDCIDANKEPGTLMQFNNSDVTKYFTQDVSAHEVGVQDLLLIRSLGDHPLEEVQVIGVQPLSLEPGLSLTETIQAQCEPALKMVLTQLEKWGVRAQLKNPDTKTDAKADTSSCFNPLSEHQA